ncbi:MAG: TonB-dependent receptor plug domain-containing protein [Ferruginibacter sp.]
MKFLFISALLCHTVLFCIAQETTNLNDTSFLQPVELNAVRASDKTPVAKTDISKATIEKTNTGQDLPFILNQTPSVVVNSDAGNGIGYTGIRIRGTDASRINVTINGIPYNDAESQGTYFVDLPDIASSAGSIQIQRGVGTSSNGAGSFGGSINVSTNDIVTKKTLEFNNSFGSYHSFKNTVVLNSGIFAKHFTFDARLSNIRSDGYIERAFTRLRSFYTSAAYIDAKNSLRLNFFSGKEKTYQAWDGIDEQTLAINRRYNAAGTEKPGEPYDNETDNYTQTHYQFFFNHKFNAYWKGNVAIFLTKGKGYYEQYKAKESFSDYGLPDYYNGTMIIDKTDLIRRLWLDNNFYGAVFSVQYSRNKTNIILGGGWNSYDGKHFGEIIWDSVKNAIPDHYRWYQLTAFKKDISGYAKWTQQIAGSWQTFVDIQVRNVDYTINGFRDNPTLKVKNNYSFFNPKAGITYTKNKTQAWFSYGRSAKEPNRDDFEAGVTTAPRPEILNDFEAGIGQKCKGYSWGINFYYMLYKNQLVLTGKINDVGAYTRTNIPNSYRAGIELQGTAQLNRWISINGNITLSKNKIKNFTEYLDDYDNGGQQTKFYKKTAIAFSPPLIAYSSLNFIPVKKFEIDLISKYVGRQYLDNTSQRSRSLHDYFVHDLRLSYLFEGKAIRSISIFAQCNNILSKKYEPNGYTFSYVYGGSVSTENFYFPMAKVNFMAGLNIKL